MPTVDKLFINPDSSIKDALKLLNKTALRVLLVVDSQQLLLGTLSDGDIRRYVLKGKGLENSIEDVFNAKPYVLREGTFNYDDVQKVFLKEKFDLVPVVNSENKVVEFISWDQVFKDRDHLLGKRKAVDLPVVIMAGGKGERMGVFTKVLPKPLIPIGDKTILELIIDEFHKQGVRNYYISINYKGGMIESYFNYIDKDYVVDFVREDDFWGTAGSLRLIKDKVPENFIVSNCDVIVKANFSEILAMHRKNNASLTILSSIQHYKIPHGVVEYKKGGQVVEIIEKPEYSFTVNTGVYLLNKECLECIPDRKRFDMTDLIKKLIDQKKKVLMYPINEADYIDIGQWGSYKKAIEDSGLIVS